jgi:hypothetical protein
MLLDKRRFEMSMRILPRVGTLVGLLILSFGQALIAQPTNQKTKLTFSQPVSVPGVVLLAGSYYFKLVDSQSNRNIVQVTNLRGDKVYAIVLAIPDYRLKPTSHTVITFGEAQPGAATPIKAWFYPGNNYGNRFVYPKSKAAEIAKTTNEPVPEIPDAVEDQVVQTFGPQAPAAPTPVAKAPAVIALYRVHIMVENPDQKEVEYQPELVAKDDLTDTAGFDAAPDTGTASSLPPTGSDLPLVAMLGILMVGGSLAMKVASKLLAR